MAKVMIVDDSFSEIQVMESVLKGAGFQVVAISDPGEAEARVATEQPDVLLLDVVMPKRNGYEVLRSLRRQDQTKGVPVVMVTSKNQETDRAWGMRQGANEYVAKPFTPDQLLGAVRRVVK
ncbi:MAG: response regulator [Gemmatimonadales bacterium]|nr:response regulator [Gemmatimonadales bacterium]